MPRGDGTGPGGQGPGTGRGGSGKGRMGGNRPGAESGGDCLCPNCAKKVPHQVGKPCSEIVCPQCGSQMMRE